MSIAQLTLCLYKGKHKYGCSKSSGITLLSVVGKLCVRVPIERVNVGIEFGIWRKQCGFRLGSCCRDRIFSVRQTYESMQRVLGVFMDLEKAYDTLDRHAVWQLLMRIDDVGRRERELWVRVWNMLKAMALCR